MRHLACIMDGNRRWAQARGLSPWYGHKEGLDAVKRIINFCIKSSISHLSLFTFALQNFKRSSQEIDFLFAMLQDQAGYVLQDFKKYEVRISFTGDKACFPGSLIPIIEKIEQETQEYKKLHVHLLFCYGAQEEILAGAKQIAEQVKAGVLEPSDITMSLFERNLWMSGVPHPDLIIRTGGAQRLSNFLLFQAAYSELYFLSCMWPEITDKDVTQAIEYYYRCKRNFGV